MRAPLSWIREFAEIPTDARAVAEACNQLGLEVEAIDEPGREIGGVVVARILDVLPHPDADKLRLADVDFGGGQTRVVCGAPNIAPGMVVPFAPAGATLPGGFRLERRTIRGVPSDGMLCSARELGLGDDHRGILELDAALALGSDVREALGLDDAVLDLAITPNRPDAMSMIGVARDLAAHFGVPLTVAEPPVSATGGAAAEAVTVEIDALDACPRYLARVARFEVGPSPAWLARRLTLAGMRPIANVVDVTNYVLLERGQPLHAFDLDRLPGRGVVVRRAEDGERMVTLDGVQRTLVADDLLICDAERGPQAIAGVMGGRDAEVGEATTAIVLESAYFTPIGIARTSKRLGLRTEASARFERGVDPEGVGTAADRAMELLASAAGAEVLDGRVDVYREPVERARIPLRTSRVNRILGTALDDRAVLDALAPLGIDVSGAGDELVATVPTFRPDVDREIDLVEEVARRVGFDTLPRTLPAGDRVGALSRYQRQRRLVEDVLVGAGCTEAVTLPLANPDALARAGLPCEGVRLANPLRAEESMLRLDLLSGLLGAAAYNAAHGLPDVRLFETGTVFRPPIGDSLLPDEHDGVAALLTGAVRRAPREPDRPVDVHDAVDIVRAVVVGLRLADVRLESATAPGFHPARSVGIVVDGTRVGTIGDIEESLLAAVGLDGPAAGFEADLGLLLGAARRPDAYEPVSRFPASAIDLAFIVEAAVPADALVVTLRGAGGGLLESVGCFDEFRSEALGPGRRSLAFALRFRAPDRTLTDDEVARLRRSCIDAVVTTHAAELRG